MYLNVNNNNNNNNLHHQVIIGYGHHGLHQQEHVLDRDDDPYAPGVTVGLLSDVQEREQEAEERQEVDDDDDDCGGGGGGGGDVACTTPEIITSICNAYITLSASASSAGHPHTFSDQSDDGHCDNQQLQAMASNKNFYSHHQQMSPCSPSLACSAPSMPSVEATRTHLIKESLKVTIQCKRKLATSCVSSYTSATYNEPKTMAAIASGVTAAAAAAAPADAAAAAATCRDDYNNNINNINNNSNGSSSGSIVVKEELTAEDEERRRRRRERNKVAATKCRNKKKERTVTLLMESDSLEQTNMSLRTEIQKLELEKQRLLEMLNNHIPECPLQMVATETTGSVVIDGDPGGHFGDSELRAPALAPVLISGHSSATQLDFVDANRGCGQAHEAIESGRGIAWSSWGNFRLNSMPHRAM